MKNSITIKSQGLPLGVMPHHVVDSLVSIFNRKRLKFDLNEQVLKAITFTFESDIVTVSHLIIEVDYALRSLCLDSETWDEVIGFDIQVTTTV